MNSPVNEILSNHLSPEPEVGMGATAYYFSDRDAFTVIEVISPKRVKLQKDKSIRTDGLGMTDAQAYRHEADPEGYTRIAGKLRSGQWVLVTEDGHCTKDGTKVTLGVRREYYDYSF